MPNDHEMFRTFMKSKEFTTAQKKKMLRDFAKSLGMHGTGKKSPKQLIPMLIQSGNGWGSFLSFFKKAGNAVYDVGKKAVNAGVQAIKDKPLSTIGKIAGVASMIPSPFTPALRTAGTALTTVGSAIGKGAKSGVAKNQHGKPVIIFG